VLNPVRARMERHAVDWPWSSYRETAGYSQDNSFLTTDWLLSAFAKKKKDAQLRYRRFVHECKNQLSPWESLKNQIYPGSDQFVEDMQCKIDPKQSLADIPGKQKAIPNEAVMVLREKI
jgi:hypothetical protein